MKARRVKGLDPTGPLSDNFERIVRVRLGELQAFMPRAADPAEITALHDMRIAAKRLRYILEIAHPCFGDYAGTAVKRIKELQDLLGEIHDCDVQSEQLEAFLRDLIAEDALALALAAEGMDDLEPESLRVARHHDDHAGVAALLVYVRARRRVLFATFGRLWSDMERSGFGARLEYALTERPAVPPNPPSDCEAA
ncbi:MAG: CHAD domain-containing protein [Solirubrobacterales bacterium]|nr:CHAD domain-containing protein [Solirubrobacterales bacterium]